MRDLYDRWNPDAQHHRTYQLSYFYRPSRKSSPTPIQQAPHTMTEEVAAFAHMIQQPDPDSLPELGWMMQVLFMSYYILCARLLALDLRQKNENQTTD